ncbi:hypothetical protein [Cellulomonas cellasea]|uniref:DUF4352 domain-containing protein n=1 Tax=Cellulomonas cellasea TaxID=43670 RepID=A0A7W4UHS9_9CELL|nr:hypothetical protein [Cellulomonas cellasea]MBB2923960.1 hypothetical protein [Cellulomonas cellasea]
MSETSTPTGPWARLGPRARAAVLALAAAVVLALVAWGLARTGGGGPDGASGAASPTPTSSPSASPDPSQTPLVAGATTDGAEPEAAPEEAAPVTVPPPAAAPASGTVAAAVGAAAEVAPQVTVTVDALERIQGDGEGPGQVDGPAVRFTVRVSNGSAGELSLVGAVVNAYFGAGQTPGVQLNGSGSAALPSTVAAGAEATGTYVFLLPADATTTRVEVYSVPGAAVLDATAATPS